MLIYLTKKKQRNACEKGYATMNSQPIEQWDLKQGLRRIHVTNYDRIIDVSYDKPFFPDAEIWVPEPLDFLKNTWVRDDVKTLVLGEPPKLAHHHTTIKYFKHAAEFADAVAFLLPKTFDRPSLLSKVHPHLHLTKSWKYSEELFQLWSYQEDARSVELVNRVKGFYFCTAHSDFFVQRTGRNAGKAGVGGTDRSVNTNFLLLNKTRIPTEIVVKRLNSIWEKQRSSGFTNVNKPELLQRLASITEQLHSTSYEEQGT
jgi:hypothetical protein